jgi:hypothetical protein
LGRPVTAEPPEPHAFWPSYASVLDGHHRTEPELVIRAADNLGALIVIIEAKPGFEQHTEAQITREIIDVARATGCGRAALIMLGADRFEPANVSVWRDGLREARLTHGLADLGVELHCSSWARIGEAIVACGKQATEWSRYADDAVHQLRNRGLLGYDGGPMFDDLDGLTVPNAVEVYNRTFKAAKNLLLTLESEQRFRDAVLVAFGGKSRLTADGGVGQGGLHRPDWEFETSMILAAYTKRDWPADGGVYVAISLTPEDARDPELHAGAFHAPAHEVTQLVWTYASAVAEPEDGKVRHPALERTDKTLLDNVWAGAKTEWVFARRDWVAGQGEDDLRWLLDRLDDAAGAWDPPSL